jgi:anti-sigma regulatory factor (Ser/Thr protein kinase)
MVTKQTVQRRTDGAALVAIRSFTACPESVGAARALLSRFATRLSPETIQAARCALSELVTNSVKHSGSAWVHVRVAVTRSALRVEVTDDGRQRFYRRKPSTDAPDGRGFDLVEGLTDRWGLERRPKTLAWFEIDDVL